eukprot:g42606.t1
MKEKVVGPKKPKFDPLEAHILEQDETLEDYVAFSIRRGLVNPFEFSEDGGAASKIRVIPPQLVPWTNARFANFLTTCGYDFTSTPSRLEGKLSPEGLMKRCKIPKSFFLSHFASVHGKLEKTKKPRRGDKLAKITMQDLVAKGGWAVATIEGNHLFCYELAANADPRWQQKNVKLGQD